MTDKSYKIQENESLNVSEPVVAYRTSVSYSDSWNPNVPFHGTQEEWWEHFHRIEEGEFMTIEEADKEFELWKKEYLANRI
jgi:hypothetical protein